MVPAMVPWAMFRNFCGMISGSFSVFRYGCGILVVSGNIFWIALYFRGFLSGPLNDDFLAINMLVL